MTANQAVGTGWIIGNGMAECQLGLCATCGVYEDGSSRVGYAAEQSARIGFGAR